MKMINKSNLIYSKSTITHKDIIKKMGINARTMIRTKFNRKH
ncbi:hypothetical protein GMMP1_960008 [Candidatus Magnetomoraceae bacterium gMMP-1]